MVQQLVADQRANSEESRNQAITLGNLAAKDQEMQMKETTFKQQQDEYERKKKFRDKTAEAANKHLFRQETVPHQNEDGTPMLNPDGTQVMVTRNVPISMDNSAGAFAGIQNFLAEMTINGIEQGVYTPEQINAAIAHGQELETKKVDRLISDVLADPTNKEKIAQVAGKLGLNPSTTSINVGQDKQGLPTIFANYVDASGKAQTYDLRPTLISLNASAYKRIMEDAKTKAGIRSDQAKATASRASAILDSARANNELNPLGKPMDQAQRIKAENDATQTINNIFKETKNLSVDPNTGKYLGNPQTREIDEKILKSARDTANKIVSWNYRNIRNPSINTGNAWSYGQVIGDAEAKNKNILIALYEKGFIDETPVYEYAKRNKDGNVVSTMKYIKTTDGTVIPYQTETYLNSNGSKASYFSEFQQYIKDQKLKQAQPTPPISPSGSPQVNQQQSTAIPMSDVMP